MPKRPHQPHQSLIHLLTFRNFVTPSSVILCHSSFALKFARKWCDARAGNPHKQALRLGVGDKKGLGISPETLLVTDSNSHPIAIADSDAVTT